MAIWTPFYHLLLPHLLPAWAKEELREWGRFAIDCGWVSKLSGHLFLLWMSCHSQNKKTIRNVCVQSTLQREFQQVPVSFVFAREVWYWHFQACWCPTFHSHSRWITRPQTKWGSVLSPCRLSSSHWIFLPLQSVYFMVLWCLKSWFYLKPCRWLFLEFFQELI